MILNSKIYIKKQSRSIKLLLCFLITAIAAAPRGYAQGNPLPSNIHRILFLGNSITYAGSYITDIEAFYIVNYPNQKFEFINEGLPSETVSGLSEEGHAGGKFPRPDLHERLDRVLALTKPDLVFACYGMNDGIYKPFDEERFQKFKDGINWLHDKVVKIGARLIHVTPPIYDELLGKSAGYADVLDRYSTWLLKQRTSARWEVADIHFPMKKYFDAHRKLDKKFALNGFALTTDGVHPGEAGHWLMARGFLLYLGQKSAADAPDIHAVVKWVPNGEQILKLVSQRQTMMKDAWLTAAGHKRPGMKTGLPLNEAQAKATLIGKQIETLLK